MGCEMMRVRSNVIRERAHRFYTERLGYEVVKQQMVFGKTLEG
jgi:catechol 2,3-dioxygenase-like lactoylglutathione lyase family enzyme